MSLISRSAERSHSCRGSDAPCPTAAMLTTFKDHLRLHAGLGEDRIDRLSAAMEHVRLEKGRSLLAPGETWASHAFVCHGCLRVFFTEEDGSQRVLFFAPEGWWATDMEGFATGEPSPLGIDAVETSDVLLVRKSTLDGLRASEPWVESVVRVLQEHTLVTIQRRVVASLHKTATQRYQDFAREYPGLDGRIPRYHIAAYVGISAEFLSTLRRRGADNRTTS
jgi:CRP-like cAMP-binding protein